MRTYLKYAAFLSAIFTLGGGLLALTASAGEDPNMVTSKVSNRGTSSSQCQYLLEANVTAGKVNWIRMIVFEDRPDYADYNKARIKDTTTELQVVPLARQPSVGVEGVREIFGVVLPETVIRSAENGLNIQIDSVEDILTIRLTRGYVNSFLRQVDAKIKKG